jgi:hypothetical protein
MRKRKKWAVKLGDFTALFLPTEGGIFHRKVMLGDGLLARLPESAVGGGD